jgi:hypothetical protein
VYVFCTLFHPCRNNLNYLLEFRNSQCKVAIAGLCFHFFSYFIFPYFILPDSLCCYYRLPIYSIVGIAMGYGLDDRGVGVRVLVESRIFTSPCCPDRLWGPPSLLLSGYQASFLRVKRPGREADHLQ